MRKLSFIILVMFLLGALIVPVSAAGPVSYDSTVNVTNTTATAGNISLTYYNPSGTVAGTYSDTIAAYETKWYVTLPGLSTAFDGSMVISSSVPLGSMSTIIGKDGSDNPMGYGSYTGFSGGSTNVYLPLLMDSNYGWSTFYYIQNVSSAAVDVTITYSDSLVVPAVTGLQPNASVKIDNQAEAHAGKKFSAQLTATGAIAVTVGEWSDSTAGDPVLAYNGFTAGVTNPILPMVNENNYAYWTAIPIQNLGSIATNVTLTYTPTKAGTACTETITIPANGQVEFGSYAFVFPYTTPPYSGMSTTCTRGVKFVGNAVVTSNSTSQPLVGLINQATATQSATLDKGASLMGIDPASATSTLVFPDVRQWQGTDHWFTSITITNLSGAPLPIGDISCRAVGTDNIGPVNLTFSNPAVIADYAGWIVDFYPGLIVNPSPLSDGFVGGIVCTSATGEIVGNANALGIHAADAIDTYIIYEAINQ
jgi:hypothetical protein